MTAPSPADDPKKAASSTGVRMFPILWGYDVKEAIVKLRLKGIPYLPVCMPWEMLAPHERQAKSNHGGQTLQRLADRGGLAPCEALAIMDGCSVYDQRLSIEKACNELCCRIAEWVTREIANAGP